MDIYLCTYANLDIHQNDNPHISIHQNGIPLMIGWELFYWVSPCGALFYRIPLCSSHYGVILHYILHTPIVDVTKPYMLRVCTMAHLHDQCFNFAINNSNNHSTNSCFITLSKSELLVGRVVGYYFTKVINSRNCMDYKNLRKT
jgi:hypothetical protein